MRDAVSVMGLLEERECVARQRVEALQAELREAQAVWERFVISRETVGQVLAEPRGGEQARLVADEQPAQVTGVLPGSVVPVSSDGLEVAVLAPDYRRIMDILAERARSGGEVMDCRQVAVALELQPVPAKVEGCGRRRSAWWRGAGWPRRARGCSVRSPGEASAHDHGHRPENHRLRAVCACFVVAGQAAGAHQPRERALHLPPFGQHGEPAGVVAAFDHRQRDSQAVAGDVDQVSGVATVGSQRTQAAPAPSHLPRWK